MADKSRTALTHITQWASAESCQIQVVVDFLVQRNYKASRNHGTRVILKINREAILPNYRWNGAVMLEADIQIYKIIDGSVDILRLTVNH